MQIWIGLPPVRPCEWRVLSSRTSGDEEVQIDTAGFCGFGRAGRGDVLQTGMVRGSMQRFITCEGAKEDFQLQSVTLKQVLM